MCAKSRIRMVCEKKKRRLACKAGESELKKGTKKVRHEEALVKETENQRKGYSAGSF